MRRKSFLDFIVKNRYIIAGVTLVLILAFSGIMAKIMEICFTVFLIILAIYIGKRIQDDQRDIAINLMKRKQEIEKDEEE